MSECGVGNNETHLLFPPSLVAATMTLDMSPSLPLSCFLYKEMKLICLVCSLCICLLSQFFPKDLNPSRK